MATLAPPADSFVGLAPAPRTASAALTASELRPVRELTARHALLDAKPVRLLRPVRPV